jgi:hypothetical protein
VREQGVPEKTHRVVEGTREDLLGADWLLLFRLLEALAGRSGANAVHLGIWFDS